MKVYLLVKSERGEGSDVLGVYYSIVGAKEGAEQRGLNLNWIKNTGDPKYISKCWAELANESYTIQEWEIE